MSRPATAVAIIPVRVDSKRLPRKALLADSGQPLFLHTWERARDASRFETVYVATDSDEVTAAAEAAGAAVIQTSPEARTGSERCAEAAVNLDCDIVVDIQGDWPEIDPSDLDRLVDTLANGSAPTATLATPLTDPEAIANPNVVKVVPGLDGNALYFSRCPIPHSKGEREHPTRRHIGVYAFTRDVLLTIPDLPSSGLAEIESLEQLRFLENGIAMQVLDTDHAPWGIEDGDDYRAFLQRLAQREGPRS